MDRPLIYASMNGQLELVKYLIKEQGANIILDENKALRTASCYGHLEIVKYLIENGADVHSFNDQALRYASGYGHLEIVKYLIENGADIGQFADYTCSFEIVKYLNGRQIRKLVKPWKEKQKFKNIC